MKLPWNFTKFYFCVFGVAAVAFIFGATINIWPMTFAVDESASQDANISSHYVTIYDQNKKLTVKTSAVTVGEALGRAGFELVDADIVEPAVNELIVSDLYINIYRSRPVIVVDGNTKIYLMSASFDAATIAKQAGLTIYDGDVIAAKVNTDFLETGAATVYEVERNGGQTITVETVLPYEEQTVNDTSLAAGQTEVRQTGEDGRKQTVYAVKFVDGVEVERELVSETIITEPVAQITAVGTQSSIPASWETCAGWAREAGVAEEDLYDALTLIYHESNCRVTAKNSSSGAYGIPQALPGSKMASYGSDWETNPVTQIKWMAHYVKERYGGWSEALAYWWCLGLCTNKYGTIAKNTYWY